MIFQCGYTNIKQKYSIIFRQHDILILSNIKENLHGTSKYHVGFSANEPWDYLHL